MNEAESNQKVYRTLNIILVIFLGSIFTYLNKSFRFDDALIYFRYIENFIDGNGLVYNIGDRFNALTSPLYIYISLLVSLITNEVETTQIILNGVLLIASGITIIYLFNLLKMNMVGLIFSFVFATAKYNYQVFGIETNLFLFLTLLTIFFYFKKNYLSVSVLGALLILTRGEGLFLMLVLAYFIYKEDRKKLELQLIIPFIILICANSVFNYLYYGNILPHTFAAKIFQGKSGLWGPASFVTGIEYLFGMFNKQAFYVLFLYMFAAIGLVKYYNIRLVQIVILFALLNTVFYSMFNIPNYHWYYSIHFLSLFMLVSLGVIETIVYIKRNVRSSARAKLSLALILIYPALTHLEIARLLVNEKPNVNYKYLGEWFRNNTDPDTKIAGTEIGHIGWYSKRHIIDVLGLTNAFNAEFIGYGQHMKWFEIYKPDYIIMHVPYWGHEQSFPILIEEGYYVIDSTLVLKGIKVLKKTGKNN